MKIVLASLSPRRKKILSFFNLPLEIVTPFFEEIHEKIVKDPKTYAINIAINKAKSISSKYKDRIILAADTIVVCNNKLYPKPRNEIEAYTMLEELQGTAHYVYTGVCVLKNDTIFTKAEETKVHFHKLTKKQIKKYHSHFYFMDKAGGYAIQDGGSIIVKKIDGCFYNIMGMPINTTRELLLEMGIDLWDFLKK